MPGTAVGPLVDAALLLRRHALAVLRGEPADGFVACSRSAPPEALRVMLASERCALPLRDRLARSGKSAFFPAALGVLESHATMELQRILSARRQLVELAGLARERRWPAIVLKGGVPAAEGRHLVDLADLDLLVAPDHAAPFADALGTQGFAIAGAPALHHLAPRAAPDALPVEIHTALEHPGTPVEAALWSRARPLRHAPLLRPAPPDHLWHLLVHVGVGHPSRRGALRDLVLIADAAAECTARELETIGGRANGHPFGDVLVPLLAAARSLGGVEAPAARGPRDAFGAVAAARYLTALMPRDPRWRHLLDAPTADMLFLRLGSAAERAALRARTWPSRVAPEDRWPVEEHLPPIGVPLRLTTRMAARLSRRLLAELLAHDARRRAARASAG